jgi:hypothetical protein
METTEKACSGEEDKGKKISTCGKKTGQDRCNSTKEIVFLSKSHITTLVEVQ